MTVNRPSGIADLVEAIETLRATDDDTRRAIASMLGFRWPTTEQRSVRSTGVRGTGTVGVPVVTTGESNVEEHPRPDSAQQRRTPRDAILTWTAAPQTAAPSWLLTTPPLPPTEDRHLWPSFPLEPLFHPRTARAIVSGALATPALVGETDLIAVLQAICRAEAITEIPLTPVPTLVRGVQVLVDRGEGMQPFAADQSWLASRIVDVVGRDRTSVLYFEDSPSLGAGVGLPEDWPAYKPPPPGTPVLLLTDLGIGRPHGQVAVDNSEEWSSFAATLAHAGCPLVAFVPYPTRRWPPIVRHRMTIVQWDRATTASTVRQAVGLGLQVVQELR